MSMQPSSKYVQCKLSLTFCLQLSSFQGGILGVAGKFPPAYMGAVFAGQVCRNLWYLLSSLAYLAGSWWHLCQRDQRGGAGNGCFGHGRCLLLLCYQVMLQAIIILAEKHEYAWQRMDL